MLVLKISGFKQKLSNNSITVSKVGDSDLLTKRKIVSKLTPLIDKTSQVSLEAAVALSVMPPHVSESLVNVLGEERYVALAL